MRMSISPNVVSVLEECAEQTGGRIIRDYRGRALARSCVAFVGAGLTELVRFTVAVTVAPQNLPPDMAELVCQFVDCLDELPTHQDALGREALYYWPYLVLEDA